MSIVLVINVGNGSPPYIGGGAAAGVGGGVRRLAPSRPAGHLLATTAVVTVKITSRGWVGKEYVFHMSDAGKPQIGCLAPGGSTLGKGC